MTLFEKKFKNIEKLLGQSNITSYEELVELLKINMESVQNDADKDAVIILGYSGNGKTTWAKEVLQKKS